MFSSNDYSFCLNSFCHFFSQCLPMIAFSSVVSCHASVTSTSCADDSKSGSRHCTLVHKIAKHENECRLSSFYEAIKTSAHWVIKCSDDKFKEFEPGLKFEKQLIYCWLTIKIVFNVSRLKLVLN